MRLQHRLIWSLLIAGAAGWSVCQTLADEPADITAAFNKNYLQQIRPLLAQYCFDCHGAENPEASIDLRFFADANSVLADRATWSRVWKAIHSRDMPPAEADQLAGDQRRQVTRWIAQVLAHPADGQPRDSGHVALRRLNRVEYDNTVQDLFQIYRLYPQFDPAKGMPDQVRIVAHRDHPQRMIDLPPDDVGYGYDNIGEVLSLPPFLMEKYFQAARRVVSIAAGEEEDRRIRRSVIFTRRGREMPDREFAQDELRWFITRAFRRPATDEEVARYTKLFDLAVENSEPYEKAIQIPLTAILVSPHFLFKVEQGVREEDRSGIRPLNDYELAVRLSYFLWSSMPDDELFRLAEEGKLRDPPVLAAQARRMLRDRKVKQLIENFPLQWLQITDILARAPDEQRYPHFHRYKYLNEAMRREALLLFEEVVVEDRSVLDLVDANYAWLNGTLADYYGVKPGEASIRNSSLFWKRYELTDRRRGGVLTMGAPLVVTSDTIRTSPVKRGKWVLETLLGAPPPLPLDNVPDLDNTPPGKDGISLREKLERHRADAQCAVCHRRMDPIGFALENYDAAGKWRDADGPLAIDASGSLADGSNVVGPVELKDLLVGQRRDDFVRCLAEHMTTYALGRKLEYYDIAEISRLVDDATADDLRFSNLVVEIVQSYPFRYQRVP